MIDTTTETLLSLTQAADELPRRRRGRKTHVSTLYRWATTGCRGVQLETIQIGATRCTSREALQRYFERLSGTCAIEPSSTPIPLRRTCAQRLRASEKAAQQLERMGT